MLKAFFGFLLAGAALIVIVVLVVGVTSTKSGSPSTDVSNSDGSEAVAPPALTVSAPQLYSDYHQNEVQADNTYKGQRIAVRGMVAEIRKDFLDNIVIELVSLNEFESVSANMLPKEGAKSAALRKWQVVTVICTGNGMVVGSPQLKDCSFDQPKRDEPVQPSAISQPTQQQQAVPEQNSSEPIVETPTQPVSPQQDNSDEQVAPIVREPPAQTQPQSRDATRIH
jgi:hypothetical protein